MSARRAAGLREIYATWGAERLGPPAVETARMGILDVVGCIVAGATSDAARTVRELVQGEGPASVPGTALRLPPAAAALANGVAGHVLDYDDMSSALLGHPSVVLVPALFAVAEARGSTGQDVVSAYVLGFEVDAWFGRVMVPRHYEAGWHATSSLGIFGATAGAARLLGLDEAAAFNALAIAASSSAGLTANFGSMTKSLHAGQAAEAAVRAALLSQRGFTASASVLDGPGGFFEAYRANEHPREAPPGLEIDRSGIGIKPYACCGAGISLIDAALDLRAGEALSAGEIESVDCLVSEMAARIMPYRSAADGLQAKYCLEYCAAVALLDGQAGLAQFDDARVAQGDVQALAGRVRVRPTARMVSGDGRFGVEMTITLRDGRTRATALELPRGHPRRPLSSEQLRAKFLQCAAPVVGKSAASAAADALGRLDALPGLEAALKPLREAAP